MDHKPYVVTVTVKAKAGMEQRLRDIVRNLVAPSRAEDGCINYYMHEANEDPGRFIVYMTWRDRAAFDKHVQSSHIQAFEKIAPEILAEPAPELYWHLLEK